MMMRNDLDIKFSLIRHGQTNRNVYPASDQIGQDPSEPLNETGKQQAKKLAARFKKDGAHFDYIFSSPYKRTIDTTEIVFEDQLALGQQYTVVPALREIYQGSGIGKSRKELYSGATFADYLSWVGMSFRFDGGENLYDVQHRIKSWLEKDVLNNPDLPANKPLNIAIVHHSMGVKCILQYVLNFDHRMTWKVSADNASITNLHYKQGEWFINCVNDTSHLR